MTNKNKEILVQAYDYSEVKEYYKIISGFLFSSTRIIRSDSILEHIEIRIQSDNPPDKIFINGEEYSFKKK